MFRYNIQYLVAIAAFPVRIIPGNRENGEICRTLDWGFGGSWMGLEVEKPGREGPLDYC